MHDQKTAMKQVTITINGKGGVGKSLFTAQYLSWLEAQGIRYTAIDTDSSHCVVA